MTTRRIPLSIVGFDSSGLCYPSTLDAELSLTNAKPHGCHVMEFPIGADGGFYVRFQIPSGYVGTPELVLSGIIDGTPANTFAVGCQQLSVGISESVDQALETEDLANNATWTGYADEERFEISITLSPASAYVVDDEIYAYVYRDDSVDDTTWNLLLEEPYFQYADA